MGFTEQKYAFEIEEMADKLNWTKGVISAVAHRFSVSGASEPNLSRAFAKTKDLSAQTAAELKSLLLRFTKMAQTFEPFILRLDDPDLAKQLLEDFEAGNLIVSVTHQEPSAVVYPVFVIESLVERNKFFQGIRNGEPQWGIDGAPIQDRLIANSVVKILEDLGHASRAFFTSVRTTQDKIAKTLADLGFVLQEPALIGADDGTN
jgi:hypothetical protein